MSVIFAEKELLETQLDNILEEYSGGQHEKEGYLQRWHPNVSIEMGSRIESINSYSIKIQEKLKKVMIVLYNALNDGTKNPEIFEELYQQQKTLHRGNTIIQEIGSLTGQHAIYCSHTLPTVSWLCSDTSENISSLIDNINNSKLKNVLLPIELANTVLLANVILPWGETWRI